MDLRFTDEIKVAVRAANDLAESLGCTYIAEEHILFGLFQAGTDSKAKMLSRQGVDLASVRAEAERTTRSRDVPPDKPALKGFLEYAIDEARRKNEADVGTLHLLIALLHDSHGVAATMLSNLGWEADELRSSIDRPLGEP